MEVVCIFYSSFFISSFLFIDFKTFVRYDLITTIIIIIRGKTIIFKEDTLSGASQASTIDNCLRILFEQRSISPYNYQQQWTVPFGQKFAKIFGFAVEETEAAMTFKQRWFKMLLEDTEYDVSTRSLDEIEELIHSNPDMANALLKNFQDPFKLPDGNFWKGANDKSVEKALVFYNAKTKEPMKLFSDSGTQFNVFMNYDLNKMLKQLGMDSTLLQNPISFSVSSKGRFIVDFNPVGGVRRGEYSQDIAEKWIEHLHKRYNVPYDVLNRLKHRIGQGTGVDLFNPSTDDEMIKIFALILADFKRNLDEAMNFLKREISLIGKSNDIDWGTDYLRNHIDQVDIDWNNNIKINGEEVELFLGQIKNRGGGTYTWESTRGVYSLGTGGSWISNIINDIKIQALNTVFQFPNDAKATDFFKWITANWGFIT